MFIFETLYMLICLRIYRKDGYKPSERFSEYWNLREALWFMLGPKIKKSIVNLQRTWIRHQRPRKMRFPERNRIRTINSWLVLWHRRIQGFKSNHETCFYDYQIWPNFRIQFLPKSRFTQHSSRKTKNCH